MTGRARGRDVAFVSVGRLPKYGAASFRPASCTILIGATTPVSSSHVGLKAPDGKVQVLLDLAVAS